MIFHWQPWVEYNLDEKRTVYTKYFHFPWKCFFLECLSLHISKINLKLKMKQKTIKWQKLRTTWYNDKLCRSMTLGIHMFVQLWNSFPKESETTKQKITYRNVMEDLFVEEKYDIKLKTLLLQKVQKMSTMLQGKTYIFAHAPYNKGKIKNGS